MSVCKHCKWISEEVFQKEQEASVYPWRIHIIAK